MMLISSTFDVKLPEQLTQWAHHATTGAMHIVMIPDTSVFQLLILGLHTVLLVCLQKADDDMKGVLLVATFISDGYTKGDTLWRIVLVRASMPRYTIQVLAVLMVA